MIAAGVPGKGAAGAVGLRLTVQGQQKGVAMGQSCGDNQHRLQAAKDCPYEHQLAEAGIGWQLCKMPACMTTPCMEHLVGRPTASMSHPA